MRSSATTLDIRQLEDAKAATLRRLWLDVKGSAPPRSLTARLMRQALAWDVQAASIGGEAESARRAWIRTIRARSGQRSGNGAATAIADGTRILKVWGGVTHEVLVSGDGGATRNGQSYTSLSAVARAMTLTNRNGPKFFGLREEARQ